MRFRNKAKNNLQTIIKKNVPSKLTENKDFYIKLIAIAVPISLQQLVVSSLNLVDTFMISSLSKEAIAGVGAANKLFFLLNLFLFGMSSGSSILTAQYFGKKDIKNIKKVYGLSLTFAMGGALFFTLLAIFIPGVVMGIFTTDAQVIREGANYLRIVGFSYILTAITFSTVFVLRSTQNVKLPMLITIIAISINTFLNWVFIYGHLGFKAYGVEGAAVATVIARLVECVLIIWLVNRFDLPPAGRPRLIFRYTKEMTYRFIKIAMPVVINEVLWSTGVTMYAVVYGRISTDAMAAMTITQTIEQIAFVLLIGTGNACAIMLGNSLGASEGEKIYQDALRFIRVNFFIGAVVGLAVIFSAPYIAGIYNVSDIIRYNIIGTLNAYGIFLMFKAVNMVIIVGILRSGGDTTFAAVIDALGVWAVAVPLAFLTGLVLKWELPFVYMAILFEEIFKISFGIRRTLSKKWMNNLVEHTNS